MTKNLNHISEDVSENNGEYLVNNVNILSNITRIDIEKSYNLDSIIGTEAYYSNRYGWILRKSID